MNKIIKEFLLAEDKIMLDLHLKQPGFTYSACEPFTKHRQRIQKYRKTSNLKHLDRIELDKTCFAQDAAYSDSKDLAKRTISNKILKERAHEITRNYNYDGYQRALACVGYKFFDQKTESAIDLN